MSSKRRLRMKLGSILFFIITKVASKDVVFKFTTCHQTETLVASRKLKFQNTPPNENLVCFGVMVFNFESIAFILHLGLLRVGLARSLDAKLLKSQRLLMILQFAFFYISKMLLAHRRLRVIWMDGILADELSGVRFIPSIVFSVAIYTLDWTNELPTVLSYNGRLIATHRLIIN